MKTTISIFMVLASCYCLCACKPRSSNQNNYRELPWGISVDEAQRLVAPPKMVLQSSKTSNGIVHTNYEQVVLTECRQSTVTWSFYNNALGDIRIQIDRTKSNIDNDDCYNFHLPEFWQSILARKYGAATHMPRTDGAEAMAGASNCGIWFKGDTRITLCEPLDDDIARSVTIHYSRSVLDSNLAAKLRL